MQRVRRLPYFILLNTYTTVRTTAPHMRQDLHYERQLVDSPLRQYVETSLVCKAATPPQDVVVKATMPM